MIELGGGLAETPEKSFVESRAVRRAPCGGPSDARPLLSLIKIRNVFLCELSSLPELL